MQANEQSNVSLYIPHVFSNFTSEYIANIFETMNIGKINHVDLVAKLDKKGKSYNSAYIHFDYWFSGPVAENFRERVLDPQREARIIHDDPWYWIILENTAKKHIPGERKICINLTQTENTDVLVTELYNQNMDFECEFREEQHLENLEKENKMLKTTNQTYLNHIKKIYKWVESAELYLQNKLLNEEDKEITITKKIFNQLIYSITLEEAIEKSCQTLYKMSYQDYMKQESIEEIPNNYELCSHCLIWYDEGKTLCDCGQCSQFD